MASLAVSPWPVTRLLELEQRHAEVEFREIRDRLERGDRKAWTLFVERYSRTIYTIALSLSGRDREEAAQEIYLAVLERLARDDFRLLRGFRADARFETYLFSAVRNEVARVRRGDARERRVARPIGEEEIAVDDTTLAESIGLDTDKVSELVSQSLDRLGHRERLLLRLRFRRSFRSVDWPNIWD